MGFLLFVAYIIFAIYSGYSVVTGRFDWLEKDAPLNKVCKYILSTTVGMIIAVFYLSYLVFKFFMSFFYEFFR